MDAIGLKQKPMLFEQKHKYDHITLFKKQAGEQN